MTTPAWILDIFAAIMLTVAGASACRLVITRSWRHPEPEADIDLAHILMGIAMAGMLAGGLRTLPAGAWVAVFAVVTAWFAWRVAAEARSRSAAGTADTGSTGHHLPHLVHGAAMIYMFAAAGVATVPAGWAGPGMSATAGMSGSMATLRMPTIGLVFVLLMAGWAVFDIDQLTGPVRRTHHPRSAGQVSEPAGLRQRLALAAGGDGPALAAPISPPALPGAAAAPIAPGRQLSTGAAGEVDKPRAAGVTAGTAASLLLSHRVTVGSRIAMSVTMALMLVLMI